MYSALASAELGKVLCRLYYYYSFTPIQAISIAPLQGHYYSEAGASLSSRCQILCLSFTPKCHRQLRIKDLPKVARAGFEPTTLRAKGEESTNEPPRPTL